MYKNAKATRRMTASAAITPPAIAAVLEPLTAPIGLLEDDLVGVAEAGSLTEDAVEERSSNEYVIESRIIKEDPSPAFPFLISKVWFASERSLNVKTVVGTKSGDPIGV
jgi:hypothetical protein